MEPPTAVAATMQRVVVAPDELHRPAVVRLEQEDDVARGPRLVLVPVRDQRVEDEVTLRPSRLHTLVRGVQRVVTLVVAEPGDGARAVRAERRDDVVGAAVVEGLRVRRERGAHSGVDVREGRHGRQIPRSATGRSNGYTLTARNAPASASWGRPARNPSIVRSKFETCPSIPADNRMYSKPRAWSPFCWRGRFEKSCAGIGGQRGSSHSHSSGGAGRSVSVSSGTRASDQSSMSVSSGPSGRNR